MLELQWEDDAQSDLLSLVVYIAADNPMAANALRNEIHSKLETLRNHPRMYKPGRV